MKLQPCLSNVGLKGAPVCFPHLFANAIFDDFGIDPRTVSGRAGKVGIVIDGEQSKSRSEALCPFEVIEVGPVEIALNVDAQIVYGVPNLAEMTHQKNLPK